MMLRSTGSLVLAVSVLLLPGCGSEKKAAAPESADSELTGSLADQIKVDPKLAHGDARAAIELPADQRTPEAIAAARVEAAKLAGGAIAPPPPPATDAASQKVIADAGTRLAGGSSGCAAKVEQGAAWARRVPAALAVYPRGHVVEAAGTDKDGCSLRVVNFVTPVALDEVLGYYYTRVRAEGLGAAHRLDGTDNVLGGAGAVGAYLVYARRLGNGLTEVDILTTGS